MTPQEVKTVVYDIGLELAANIALPLLTLMVTCFIATVSAAWILTKRLVTRPIDNLTEKFELLSVKMVEVESGHGQRLINLEQRQHELNRKQNAFDNRMHKLETSSPRS